jgi:hypothetical protein
MTKLYAVYSKRGLHIRTEDGKKTIYVTGKERAEQDAEALMLAHKQRYWVEQVKITKVK